MFEVKKDIIDLFKGELFRIKAMYLKQEKKNQKKIRRNKRRIKGRIKRGT